MTTFITASSSSSSLLGGEVSSCVFVSVFVDRELCFPLLDVGNFLVEVFREEFS